MQSENTPVANAERLFPAWKGIVWWGLPVAIISAVYIHDEHYGTSLAGFLTVEFAVHLVVSILITGFAGGWFFARFMDDHLRRKHRR